jgi:hypothetical protein
MELIQLQAIQEIQASLTELENTKHLIQSKPITEFQWFALTGRILNRATKKNCSNEGFFQFPQSTLCLNQMMTRITLKEILENFIPLLNARTENGHFEIATYDLLVRFVQKTLAKNPDDNHPHIPKREVSDRQSWHPDYEFYTPNPFLFEQRVHSDEFCQKTQPSFRTAWGTSPVGASHSNGVTGFRLIFIRNSSG